MNLKDSKSKKIIVAISIILLVIIFMATFVITQIGPYNKNNKEDIVIDIPSGSTLNQIADILKENNLIKNKTLFKLYVRVSDNSSKLKSGKYLFNQTYSNKEIIEDISSGKIYNDGIKITIAKYYTPNGVSIDGTGIEPDKKVEDKDYYLISDGIITNIDENQQKENKKSRYDMYRLLALQVGLEPTTL